MLVVPWDPFPVACGLALSLVAFSDIVTHGCLRRSAGHGIFAKSARNSIENLPNWSKSDDF